MRKALANNGSPLSGFWHGLAAGRLLLIACSLMIISSCNQNENIKIGFAASLSGKDYMLGVDGRNAVELFVREINSQGGIQGRRLELLVHDLASDLSKVVPVDTTLHESGVIAILGHFTSTEVETALPFINHKELPLISPAATSESLSDKNDFFFRTIMSSRDDGTVLANHMLAQNLRRIVLIATALNPAYVTTYYDSLIQKLDIVQFLEYSKIDDVRTKLISDHSGVDAIFIIASSIDTGTIAQMLRARNMTQPLYASGWAGNDDLIQYGGSAVENLVFVHQINPELPDVQTFAHKFRAVYGNEPGFGAIEAWDAMLYIYTALKIQRKKEPFVGALRRVSEFRGISGNIKINRFGDAERQLYLKTVRNGKIVIMDPAIE